MVMEYTTVQMSTNDHTVHNKRSLSLIHSSQELSSGKVKLWFGLVVLNVKHLE